MKCGLARATKDGGYKGDSMSEVSFQTLPLESVLSQVLTQLNHRQIEEVVDSFAAAFRFKDYGIGLEFSDKQRLTEFFQKTRELYPDYSLQTEQLLVSGDHVITLWTLQVSVTEPFYGGLSRNIPLSIPGVSIVRIGNGKITDWADYYDGLTSRRTALAAQFTEWIEY
jgi:hypothetical protein